jgi:hypothetical protein
MFYIPAMTYAFSENTGNSVLHSKRAIDYVRTHWPFFNRCALLLPLSLLPFLAGAIADGSANQAPMPCWPCLEAPACSA